MSRILVRVMTSGSRSFAAVGKLATCQIDPWAYEPIPGLVHMPACASLFRSSTALRSLSWIDFHSETRGHADECGSVFRRTLTTSESTLWSLFPKPRMAKNDRARLSKSGTGIRRRYTLHRACSTQDHRRCWRSISFCEFDTGVDAVIPM